MMSKKPAGLRLSKPDRLSLSKPERRNVLATPPGEEQSAMWKQLLSQIADPERIEPPKAKGRKREWEKENRPKHYRGVPKEVRQQVKEIAEDLSVTADEVARAFLEYGLQCLENGTLRLEGYPSQRRARMTLYPFTGAGWAENAWNPQPARRIRKTDKRSERRDALWREDVCYRIPDGLHARIKHLAGEAFPLGELVSILLKHGIESYNAGVLVLLPQPKIPSNLGWKEGQK